MLFRRSRRTEATPTEDPETPLVGALNVGTTAAVVGATDALDVSLEAIPQELRSAATELEARVGAHLQTQVAVTSLERDQLTGELTGELLLHEDSVRFASSEGRDFLIVEDDFGSSYVKVSTD